LTETFALPGLLPRHSSNWERGDHKEMAAFAHPASTGYRESGSIEDIASAQIDLLIQGPTRPGDRFLGG
jgi:hypothetical protein